MDLRISSFHMTKTKRSSQMGTSDDYPRCHPDKALARRTTPACDATGVASQLHSLWARLSTSDAHRPDNGGKPGSGYFTLMPRSLSRQVVHPAALGTIQRRRTDGLAPSPALCTAASALTIPFHSRSHDQLSGASISFATDEVNDLCDSYPNTIPLTEFPERRQNRRYVLVGQIEMG
jgi:hypothetical protein